MKTSEILRAAWARIEDPARWCQGTYGTDDSGEAVDFPRATRMCAEGALFVESGRDWSHMAHRYLIAAARFVSENRESPVYVNDYLGHSAVGEMYAHAIAAAEADEAKAVQP